MIKISDYIAQHLRDIYHVRNIFLISGGGAMHLNDSFGRYIPYTIAHNEQALAIMAEGYARVNQELAVVNVTTGPGGLNCLNGLFGQWTDSVPVLYLSGQVKSTTTIASFPTLAIRQLGDQECNITALVQNITKYSYMVTDPLSIKYHLDKALYLAIHGRPGPVWLDIPLDIQGAYIDEKSLHEFIPPESPTYSYNINTVLQKILHAERPLVIAGHGIRLAKQEKTFLKIIESLQIPVVTTLNGVDLLPTNHPLYIGRIGTIGQRAGNFALQNADCVMCLGTRNNIRQISYNYENFAKDAYKIVVDIDLAELQKSTVIPDLPIHADLAHFLPLLEKSALHNIQKTEWIESCIATKKYFDYPYEKYQKENSPLHPYEFTRVLSENLDDTAICITANATACVAFFQTALISHQRVIWNSGCASMGYGLPCAIGAAIAEENRQIVCIEGDGSFMMNLQELQTIKEYNLPIKIFIINNKGYSSIKQTQDNFFEARHVGCNDNSAVSTPSFSDIANAFRLSHTTIDLHTMLTEKIQEIFAMEGPVICEVFVDSEYIFTPKLSSKTQEDGTIISASLEDMYPFLEREEYNSHNITN